MRTTITSTMPPDVYDHLLARYRLKLEKAVEYFLEIAKEKAPKKTGDSANRMFLKKVIETPIGATWQLMVSKGLFFTITGTRPHIIRPVNAKFLRWVDTGGTHFAKFVRHPGTKKQDWLKQAIKESNLPRFMVTVGKE